MIKSVVREFHFKPKDIDDLFLDENDYHGIIYWYKDAVQVNKELKGKTK